jgi:hypothetical protein
MASTPSQQQQMNGSGNDGSIAPPSSSTSSETKETSLAAHSNQDPKSTTTTPESGSPLSPDVEPQVDKKSGSKGVLGELSEEEVIAKVQEILKSQRTPAQIADRFSQAISEHDLPVAFQRMAVPFIVALSSLPESTTEIQKSASSDSSVVVGVKEEEFKKLQDENAVLQRTIQDQDKEVQKLSDLARQMEASIPESYKCSSATRVANIVLDMKTSGDETNAFRTNVNNICKTLTNFTVMIIEPVERTKRSHEGFVDMTHRIRKSMLNINGTTPPVLTHAKTNGSIGVKRKSSEPLVGDSSKKASIDPEPTTSVNTFHDELRAFTRQLRGSSKSNTSK